VVTWQYTILLIKKLSNNMQALIIKMRKFVMFYHSIIKHYLILSQPQIKLLL